MTHKKASGVAVLLSDFLTAGDLRRAFNSLHSAGLEIFAVQILAPDGMLGRASSLITAFAQATNGLGALLAGVAAQYIGAPNALLVGSALCFIMILAICLAIPQLWRYQS